MESGNLRAQKKLTPGRHYYPSTFSKSLSDDIGKFAPRFLVWLLSALILHIFLNAVGL